MDTWVALCIAVGVALAAAIAWFRWRTKVLRDTNRARVETLRNAGLRELLGFYSRHGSPGGAITRIIEKMDEGVFRQAIVDGSGKVVAFRNVRFEEPDQELRQWLAEQFETQNFIVIK